VPIDGQGVTGTVSNITFRNNVLHDSFNNDILKINNAASLITVTGNMFYNQGPSSISGDEHYRGPEIAVYRRSTGEWFVRRCGPSGRRPEAPEQYVPPARRLD
jgi:hypothetical protein